MAEIVVKILRKRGNCTLRVPVIGGHEYGYLSKMIASFADFNRPLWLRSIELGYHSSQVYSNLKGM